MRFHNRFRSPVGAVFNRFCSPVGAVFNRTGLEYLINSKIYHKTQSNFEVTILSANPTSSENSSAALVRLDRLSKAYNEAGQNRIVLNQVSQEFYEGEFICLLGKSGSGKSTLLNLISGIDAPSSGHVFIREGEQEVDLTYLNEHQRTLFRRRHIGIIFQFFNLIPTLTVLENVTLPLELTRGAESQNDGRTRAGMLLNQVGLGERLNTYPDKLSGGEQQRVAIARALVHNPLMLLADEPTGNLDTEIGETVLSLLLEMIRGTGKILLMATHAQEIANRADRVLHIIDGVLINDTGT